MPKRRSDELAAIDEVMPLVDRFNELEHAQRLIFLDMVDPLPEEEPAPTGKPTKVTAKRKIERCEVCNYTRRALQHVNPQHVNYHEFVLAEKASKKSSKSRKGECAACDYSKIAPIHHDSALVGYHVYQPTPKKSPRASGMAAQLKSRVSEQREVAATMKDDDDYDGVGQCSDCGMAADMPIHSPEGGYITYHPFRSAAPTAPAPSSANGGAGSTTQSLEASAVSAQAATAGLSSED